MRQRGVLSWCLYDWANSAFVLTVVTAFFPFFFKSYYCGAGVDPIKTTMWLGVGHTAAGIIIAGLSLVLGALADFGAGKKRFLLIFAAMGALSTAALFLTAQGAWALALTLFILGNIGFSCANLFYDALLVDVADNRSMDFVSSMGFAFGYVGGVVLFAFNMWMTARPAAFGLPDAAAAVRISFLSVAVWWMVFSIPLFLFVRENRPAASQPALKILLGVINIVNAAGTIRTIWRTFFAIVRNPALILFLVAYWFYFDGVNTFIRMAVDFGLSIGFGYNALMAAMIASQVVAFPSSLLFGYLAARAGAGRMIAAGVAIYILISGFGSLLMRTEAHFIAIAGLSGLAQGGVQALSRSYFGKLIPADESTEYFGFYNVVSRFAVLGPMVIGVVAAAARGLGAQGALASRIGMSSVNLFFVMGLIFLLLAERSRARAAREPQQG